MGRECSSFPSKHGSLGRALSLAMGPVYLTPPGSRIPRGVSGGSVVMYLKYLQRDGFQRRMSLSLTLFCCVISVVRGVEYFHAVSNGRFGCEKVCVCV